LLDHGVGSAGFSEARKQRTNRSLHLLVRVKPHMAQLIVGKPYGKWEVQLPLLRLVQLATLEARADEVKFGLGHRPLETQ
jgi:hypothetical protein